MFRNRYTLGFSHAGKLGEISSRNSNSAFPSWVVSSVSVLPVAINLRPGHSAQSTSRLLTRCGLAGRSLCVSCMVVQRCPMPPFPCRQQNVYSRVRCDPSGSGYEYVSPSFLFSSIELYFSSSPLDRHGITLLKKRTSSPEAFTTCGYLVSMLGIIWK